MAVFDVPTLNARVAATGSSYSALVGISPRPLTSPSPSFLIPHFSFSSPPHFSMPDSGCVTLRIALFHAIFAL